jgi:hypothetical protein
VFLVHNNENASGSALALGASIENVEKHKRPIIIAVNVFLIFLSPKIQQRLNSFATSICGLLKKIIEETSIYKLDVTSSIRLSQYSFNVEEKRGNFAGDISMCS